MNRIGLLATLMVFSIYSFAHANDEVFCNGDLSGEYNAQATTLFHLKSKNIHTGTAYYGEDEGIKFLVQEKEDELSLSILKIKDRVETPFVSKRVSVYGNARFQANF